MSISPREVRYVWRGGTELARQGRLEDAELDAEEVARLGDAELDAEEAERLEDAELDGEPWLRGGWLRRGSAENPVPRLRGRWLREAGSTEAPWHPVSKENNNHARKNPDHMGTSTIL